MFRSIPGNGELIISLSQELRKLDGSLPNVPIVNGKVKISIYGNSRWFDLKWLSLIAHFELDLPGDKFSGLMNVEFCDTNITFFKPISSKVPVFKKPICVTKEDKVFRVIPQFSRYAVSKDGVVIEWETLDRLRVRSHRSDSVSRFNESYPLVYIYNPETLHYRYVTIHRLVAMAWVKNPDNDYVDRPIVNHMDGNKLNYHASNLEWCTFKHNNVHAVNAGLRGDNIKCEVRDFDTGIVREFGSLSQAEQFMGMAEKSLRTNALKVRKGILISDKYEFRLEGDSTPWFYESRKEKVKPGRYMVAVTHEDGKIEEFYDVRDFVKAFALWNCPGMSKLFILARARHPGKKFELTDFYQAQKIQAYHLATNTIIETKTMTDMIKKTGVSDSALVSCLRGHETLVENGYAYRYKSNQPWNTNFIDRPVKLFTRFKVINDSTGEEHEFKSIREAAKKLHACRVSIKNCLENGVKLKGWSLVKLPE